MEGYLTEVAQGFVCVLCVDRGSQLAPLIHKGHVLKMLD